MASIIELATLSSDVYHAKPAKLKYWSRISNKDISRTTRPSDPFYAALYINFRNGKAHEAVIAIRGTVPKILDNDLVDIYSWYSSALGSDEHDHLPKYFGLAICFVNKALKYLKQYFPDVKNIFYTGHSLGGAIAQLLALRYRPFKTVVFNSPGCAEIAGSQWQGRKAYITSVNSHYGIINKIGKLVLGNLTMVDVPNLETEAKAIYERFNKGDFTKGKALAQAADDPKSSTLESIKNSALSAYYHADAIAHTVPGLASVPNVMQQLSQCTPLAWSGLAGILQVAGCDLATLLHSYADVISAQHSIDNMIAAMSNSKNIHVVDVKHETV